jgi:hypothetical protein
MDGDLGPYDAPGVRLGRADTRKLLLYAGSCISARPFPSGPQVLTVTTTGTKNATATDTVVTIDWVDVG